LNRRKDNGEGNYKEKSSSAKHDGYVNSGQSYLLRIILNKKEAIILTGIYNHQKFNSKKLVLKERAKKSSDFRPSLEKED
jgi:hypothetical protein